MPPIFPQQSNMCQYQTLSALHPTFVGKILGDGISCDMKTLAIRSIANSSDVRLGRLAPDIAGLVRHCVRCCLLTSSDRVQWDVEKNMNKTHENRCVDLFFKDMALVTTVGAASSKTLSANVATTII